MVYYRGSSHVVQDLEGYNPAARFAPLSSPLIEENMIQLNHHFRTYPLRERESICPVFLMYRDTWYFLHRLQHPYFGRKSIKPPFTTPFTRGPEHPWTPAVEIGLSAIALYVTWSAGALNTETLVFKHYLRQVRYHNSLPPSSAFFKP
jgi:hypothetical protein